jgi:hypothetical protein
LKISATLWEQQNRAELLSLGKAEVSRENADDFVGLAIEPHGLADDLGVGTEPTTPEGVANDDVLVIAWLIVAFEEGTAALGLDT